MHELSICLALVQQVESIARERNASAVLSIELEVGPLSGVEPDLLRNAYPLAAAGTVAEHAEIEIETTEVSVRCTSCGARSTAQPNRLVCAACGDFRTRVVAGEELTLRRLELRTADVTAVAARR